MKKNKHKSKIISPTKIQKEVKCFSIIWDKKKHRKSLVITEEFF